MIPWQRMKKKFAVSCHKNHLQQVMSANQQSKTIDYNYYTENEGAHRSYARKGEEKVGTRAKDAFESKRLLTYMNRFGC